METQYNFYQDVFQSIIQLDQMPYTDVQNGVEIFSLYIYKRESDRKNAYKL
jgi:hypothetical protein